MYHTRAYIAGGLAIVAVWAIALTGIALARTWVVTPQTVTQFLEDNPLTEQMPAGDREKTIGEVVALIDQLPAEQQRDFRIDQDAGDAFRTFVDNMTLAERRQYLDQTIPETMKHFMEAFENMPPQQRQALVQMAMERWTRARQRGGGEPGRTMPDEDQLRQFIEQGSGGGGDDPQQQINLLPLFEQMQRIMRRGRGRPFHGEPDEPGNEAKPNDAAPPDDVNDAPPDESEPLDN